MDLVVSPVSDRITLGLGLRAYSRGINLKTELLVSTVPTWFEYLGDLLATVNLKIILKLKD